MAPKEAANSRSTSRKVAGEEDLNSRAGRRKLYSQTFPEKRVEQPESTSDSREQLLAGAEGEDWQKKSFTTEPALGKTRATVVSH